MSVDYSSNNQVQARHIYARGWVSAEILQKALKRAGTNHELCQLLEERQLITSGQGRLIRRAVERARVASQSAERSSSRSDSNRSSEADSTPNELIQTATNSSQLSDEESYLLLSQQLGDLLSPQLFQLLRSKYFRRYLCVGEPHVGGMGFIIRAFDQKRKRYVAIKFLKPDAINDRSTERFKREAKGLQKLDHPHIVKLHKYGVHGDFPFCVMDWIDGEPLDEWVEAAEESGTTIDPDRLLRIGAKVAQALMHCHHKGLTHRDLKPSNIMIDKSTQEPVLVDFGLVYRTHEMLDSLSSVNVQLSQSGELTGTPLFMAPEQIERGGVFGEISAKTDVWGLGATLFLCLTGKTPFSGVSLAELSIQILRGEPKNVHELAPHAPYSFRHFVVECLRKQPAKRADLKTLVDIAEGRLEIKESITTQFKQVVAPKYWPVFLGAVFVLVLTLALFFLSPAAPTWKQRPKARSTVTRKSSIGIAGQIQPAGYDVEISGRVIPTDSKGVFRTSLKLSPGTNKFEIQIRGYPDSVQELTVERDQNPPTVKWFGELDTKNRVLLNSIVLRGRLIDQFPGEVTLQHWDAKRQRTTGDEKKLSLDQNHEFQTSLEETGQIQHFMLIARDQAGNTSNLVVAVVTPQLKADPKQNFVTQTEARAISILDSVQDWYQASDAEKGEAVAIVCRRLGDQFEIRPMILVGPDKARNAIGCIRHKKTRVDFLLIPGGQYQKQWWNPPDLEFLYRYCRFLASSRADAESLGGAVATPPFPELAELAKRLIKKHQPDKIVKFNIESLTRFFEAYPEARQGLRGRLLRYSEQVKNQAAITERTHKIKPFLLSRFELTVQQWRQILGGDNAEGLTLPITRKSYEQCDEWLRRADTHFRFPTVLEWQYACAGNQSTWYFWGQEAQAGRQYVWGRDNSQTLHSVFDHQEQANGFGLVDMIGHAEEWADPDWKLWEKSARQTSRNSQKVSLQTLRSLGAVMGGSMLWKIGEVRRDFFFYKPRTQPWLMSGLRPACSIK